MTEDPARRTVIIGAGPGGCTAAVYLARSCWPVTLIDAPREVHGRTSMATSLENFPGHAGPMKGEEFITRLHTQVSRYAVDRMEAKVTRVVQADDGLFAVSAGGNLIMAAYLIVAVGVKDSMPPIEGMGPYYDHSIFHCLTCDWYQRRDKPALYVTDDSDGLESVIARVTMHRPPSCTVVPSRSDAVYSPVYTVKLKGMGVDVFQSPLKRLEGENGYLKAAWLEDGTRFPAEVMFTHLGWNRLDTFLDEGGITLKRDERGFIDVDFSTMESSVPNLYAVGPCNTGMDQAVIAAGQGALAAERISRKILQNMGI